jgi:hypothetical protein
MGYVQLACRLQHTRFRDPKQQQQHHHHQQQQQQQQQPDTKISHKL